MRNALVLTLTFCVCFLVLVYVWACSTPYITPALDAPETSVPVEPVSEDIESEWKNETHVWIDQVEMGGAYFEGWIPVVPGEPLILWPTAPPETPPEPDPSLGEM